MKQHIENLVLIDPKRSSVKLGSLAWNRCFGLIVSMSIFVVFFLPRPVHAKDTVYYAGLAYLGDYDLVDQNYPITRRLDRAHSLSKALRKAIDKKKLNGLDLRFDLGDLDSGQTTAIAIAVERERVSHEFLELSNGEKTKITVDLALRILLYDLKRGLLIDQLPLAAACNDLKSGIIKQIEVEAEKCVRSLYFGDDGSSGLLHKAASLISSYQPRDSEGLRFQLTRVTLADSVRNLIPGQITIRQIEQRIGQGFSAELALKTGVAVIPFTRGYALGNQLPGRFANGEVFNLKLPDPDYAFQLEIRKLIYTKDKDGDDIFGVQARFTFLEPYTDKRVIEGDFQKGIFRHGNVGGQRDDWSAYEDVIEALTEDLVDQLRKSSRKWHEDHARAPSLSYKQFTSKDFFNAK